MSVEKITEKILSDAHAEVKKIEQQIAEQVKALEGDQQDQVRSIEAEAQEEGERRAKDRESKDIATAELELRKALLAQKQNLIQEVFDQALRRLATMDGEEKGRFLADLLMKTVEVGDEEVVFSSADDEVGERVLKEVNEKLVKEGKKGELRLVREDRGLRGGFVLRRGKREVNCSLTALFRTVREELEPQVAKILFS